MILLYGFWTVFTFPAIVIAIFSGAATGWLLGHAFPPNPLIKGPRVMFAFGIIGFIGVVFYIGQGVEVALGAEPTLWTRLLARTCIWIIFSFSLAVAGTIAQGRRWPKR
jgi:hypothetical protein